MSDTLTLPPDQTIGVSPVTPLDLPPQPAGADMPTTPNVLRGVKSAFQAALPSVTTAPKTPREDSEPWEAESAGDEDEPWNAGQLKTKQGDFRQFQLLEGLPWDIYGQAPDAERLSDYVGYQTLDNIVASFPAAKHGAETAWQHSAIVPGKAFEVGPKTREFLKTWPEYTEIERQQLGVMQAFNAVAVFPPVRALADAIVTFANRQIDVAQGVILQAPAAAIGGLEEGLREFGNRQSPNTSLGRDLASVVEMGNAFLMGRAGMHQARVPLDNGLRFLRTDKGVEPVLLKEPVAPGDVQARVETADGRIIFVPPEDVTLPLSPVEMERAAASGLTGDKVTLTPEEAVLPAAETSIHTEVRDANKALFDAYDPLMAEREKVRANLAEREAELRHRAEMNAAEGATEDAISADHERRMAEDSQIDGWVKRLRELDDKIAEFEPEVRDAYKRATPEAPPGEPVAAGAEVPEPPQAPSATNIADHMAEKLLKAWEASKREGTPEQFEKEARAGGALVEAFFQTLSERFGGRKGTAAQLYDRLGPEIEGVGTLGPGGTASGATTFNPKDLTHIIRLARRSDASTFVHELAHMMTNLMFKVGENARIDEGIRNDIATLQKWVKSQPGRMLTTAQHERVAVGFEKYLAEGRAPSRELAGVFAQFKEWLKNVYENFRQKNVALSDDIRKVFDRWLTTTPETQAAAIAPETRGPPRIMTASQILQKWALEGKDASSRRAVAAAKAEADQSILDYADWQAARRAKGLPTTDEAVPQSAAAGEEAPRATETTPSPTPAAETTTPAQPPPPPRPRSRDQILQQWSLEGKSSRGPAALRAAQEQSNAEFIALAEWQEARRNKGLPLAETEAERAARTAPKEAPPPEPAPPPLPENAALTGETATRRVPRKPKSLTQWLKDSDGISEDHPEIAKADLYDDSGRSIQQAAQDAIEAGYLEDAGTPAANAANLLDAIRQENEGTAIYANKDAAAAKAFNDAVLHNQRIRELADKHGVDPAGKTLEAFLAEVKEKIGEESFTKEASALHDDAVTKGEELRETAENVRDNDVRNVDAASEPDLEALWKAATEEGAARQLDVGAEDGGGRGSAAGDKGASATDVGGERGGAGPTRSAGEGGGKRAPLPESEPAQGQRGGITSEARADMEKVGNIRWDYFENDLFALARDTMAKLGWFPDNAGPTEGVFRARAVTVLMNKAWEELQAAKTAVLESPNGENAIAFIKAQRNAAKATIAQSEMLADWGKTGNALREILKVNRARIAEIERLGDVSDKTLFQIQEQIRLADTYESIDQYNRFMMDVNTTRYQKFRQGILSFYINNLLSNPITHAGYLLGNELINLYKTTYETAVQAGVSSARQTLAGVMGREITAADRVHIGEVKAALHGSWTGTQVGVRAAWNAWRTGEMLMQGISDKPSPRQQTIFGLIGIAPEDATLLQKGLNQVGYVAETPTRMIQAIHVFSYARAYGAELGRLAYHDAILRVGEGAAPETIGAAIQRFYNAVPEEARVAAHDEAIRTVLMRAPTRDTAAGRAIANVNQWINQNALAKAIFPFNQIGLNLATEGVGRRSILALSMPDVRADLSGANGGRAFDLAAGRILAGSALAAGVITMATMGLITGPGPSRNTQAGRNFAAVREDEGIANDAFRMGDVYVPYLKVLGPIGQLMSLAVSFKDSVAYMTEGEATEAALNLSHGFGHAVIDDTAFRTLHDVYEAILTTRAGGKGGIAPFLENIASNFMPFSSAVNGFARQVDPYRRKADGMLEILQRKVPFASERLPESVGPWGTGIISHTTMGIHLERNDPVNEAFIRMGMGPAPFPKKINGMDMDTREFEQYAHLAGAAAHQMLLPLVTSPGFEQIPPGIRMDIMGSIISASRASAQAQISAMNPQKFLIEGMALHQKMMLEGRPPAGTPAMRQQ